MSVFISFLRGINVGGHNKIRMADLQALYESLGLRQVTTYIQSGNVLFTANTAGLKEKCCADIGNAIKAKWGFDVPVVIRTAGELHHILTGNPFPEEAQCNPDKLVLMFLASPPNQETITKVTAIINDGSRFAIQGDTIYFFYPEGYGQTKWHTGFFEKQLKTTVTARNWTTICKLAAMAGELPA